MCLISVHPGKPKLQKWKITAVYLDTKITSILVQKLRKENAQLRARLKSEIAEKQQILQAKVKAEEKLQQLQMLLGQQAQENETEDDEEEGWSCVHETYNGHETGPIQETNSGRLQTEIGLSHSTSDQYLETEACQQTLQQRRANNAQSTFTGQ